MSTPVCKIDKFAMALIWVHIRKFIDCIVDFVFAIIYYSPFRKTLPPIENKILLKSATELAHAIRNRELTSKAVVEAFVERIRQVNDIINAVVDERFEAAFLEASEVDELLDSGRISQDEARTIKPFLGVPFTAKESTSCRGMSFTIGAVARKGIVGDFDAEVVQLLKNAGGILIGVTNVPELNLWCETRSNVYGQTNNPYNVTRTVGGSSGGEGAIIAACGSPLGIGSDIGGSIRMPAFYCGVYGHKPTTGILSIKGLSLRTVDDVNTMVCHGPMCKNAEDLAPTLKVLAGEKADLLNLNTKVHIKDVRITFMEETGDLKASSVTSETREVLLKAVHHLGKCSSYAVEKLHITGFEHSFRLWRYWSTKEPGNLAKNLTNGKGEVEFWQEFRRMVFGCSNYTLPALLRLLDQKYFPQENSEWAESTKSRLEEQLLEKLGSNAVLLFPSHPFPASYHYSSFFRPYNFAYWGIFNVLKLPVTQVPLGLSGDGLPLGIQVVAGPGQDHLCLAVAIELEKAFGGFVPPCPVIYSD